MKTKKLLSLVLTITMVVSMVTTIGFTASAEHRVNEETVGETGTYTICDSVYSSEDGNNHVKDIVSTSSSIIRIDSVQQIDNDIVIHYSCLAEGEVSIEYSLFVLTEWKPQSIDFEVYANENECFLDLETSTADILDSTSIDQNYTITVNDPTYTDVTKVKVEWNIKNINATRKESKIWNPDTLSWVAGTTSSSIENGTATFKITNLSSIKLNATVEFEAKEGFNPTVEYTGVDEDEHNVEIDTVVDSGDKSVDSSATHAAEVTVKVTPSSADFVNKSATESSKYGTYTITIAECEEEPQCFAAGTKITMADGSQKAVETITEGEKVLSFNHETGVYEAKEVYFVFAGAKKDNGFELCFSDGTKLTIVGEHDLFEKESLRYVTITEENAKNIIGNHYYNAETGKFVELTGVKTAARTNYYCLYVKNNFNCIANGMLSLPTDVDYLLNLYQFNADLTADMNVLSQDLENYGIHEYRADAPYSEEVYDMLNMKYIRIVIGKGLMTLESLVENRDLYISVQ